MDELKKIQIPEIQSLYSKLDEERKSKFSDAATVYSNHIRTVICQTDYEANMILNGLNKVKDAIAYIFKNGQTYYPPTDYRDYPHDYVPAEIYYEHLWYVFESDIDHGIYKKEDNAFVLRYLGSFDGLNGISKELLEPYLKMSYPELRKIRFSVSNYPNWLSCYRGTKYCLTDFIFTNSDKYKITRYSDLHDAIRLNFSQEENIGQ